MTIEEILSLPSDKAIEELKNKGINVPKWGELEKEYSPAKHPIVSDLSLRPKDKTSKGGHIEKVAKLTYAAEKIATRRMVQMAFTIPVKRKYNHNGGKVEEQISDAIERVYNANRINGVNVNRFRAYFAACEMCTIWYAVQSEQRHHEYGFETNYKLRCRSYSPMDPKMSKISQANLYPYFDEYDDMTAMSIEYTRKEGDEYAVYFETFTADKVLKWRKAGDKIEEIYNGVSPIGKIQVSYIYRPMPIYEGVSNNRNEIEFALSRQSDIIRKNSSPIIKIVGQLLNNGDKPEPDAAREVYQLDQGGDIATVSPAINPESAKTLIAQLKENIEEETQMPNLSLTNIKDLGNIGEGARKTLITDAHMKVGEEKHDIVWFLERECSIVKSFLKLFVSSWDKAMAEVRVSHEITPFVLNDEKEKSEVLATQVGAKIKSRKTAIVELGNVDDVDREIQQIAEEDKQDARNRSVVDVFNTAE